MYTHSLTSAQIVLDWILRLALLACLLAPLIQHAKYCAKMSPSVLHGFTTRQGYVCFYYKSFSHYDTSMKLSSLLRYQSHNIINDPIIFDLRKVKLEET